jgi:Tol biopolymer transport system component
MRVPHRLVFLLVSCTIALVVASTALGDPVQLTTSSANDMFPSWAPDGQWIVFQSDRDGRAHVWKIPAAGGTAVQLTSGDFDDRYPMISPDGSLVAFTRQTTLYGDPVGNIYVVPIDGGVPTQVSQSANEMDLDWHPAWTADGNTLYFTRRDGTSYNHWSFKYVPLSGGVGSTYYDPGGIQGMMRFSPDSAAVYYSWQVDGGYATNIVTAPIGDPTNWTQITFESTPSNPLCVSPDSRYMIYAPKKFSGSTELYAYDTEDQSHTRLTYDSVDNTVPTSHAGAWFSPSGDTLVYAARRNGGNEDLWIMPFGAVPPPQTVLQVGSTHGLPGGTGEIRLPVSLQNAEYVRALDFTLADVPDWITVVGAETHGRASGMTASVADAGGQARILVYHPSNPSATIAPGSDEVLDLLARVDSTAVLGDTVAVQGLEGLWSDPDNVTHTLATTDGFVSIERLAGDLNGDNAVDVGDVVRLVEIILGQGDPPTSEELALADCNRDGNLDVGDVGCEVDLVFSGSAAPADRPIGPASTGNEVTVTSNVPVSGLQLTLKGSGHLAPLDGARPMAVYEGWMTAGTRQVIAFDPDAGGWTQGSRTAFVLNGAEIKTARAYGRGGHPLVTDVRDHEILIHEVAPKPVLTLANNPNPFFDRTALRFSLPQAGRVALTIYDVRGAVVRTFPGRVLPAGDHVITWDARDDRGVAMPAGVYFAALRWGGKTRAVRITRLGAGAR